MLKTLNNYVLIELEPPKETTLESGIILPELRKDVPQTGTIVSVPSGNHGLTEGQKVWFKMWAGQDVEYAKKKYKSVHIKDLIAYET